MKLNGTASDSLWLRVRYNHSLLVISAADRSFDLFPPVYHPSSREVQSLDWRETVPNSIFLRGTLCGIISVNNY